MGKLFAVVVTAITVISVAFFVMYTWWPPVDIATTDPAIDHQLDETFVEAGMLFLAGQLVLALFVWQASDENPARKIKIFPGGSTPLVTAAIIVVGIEILALTFMGSRAWAPAVADFATRRCIGGTVCFLVPLCGSGRQVSRTPSRENRRGER